MKLQCAKKRKLTAHEAQLRCQFNSGKTNCLTIIAKKLFAFWGLLTFFPLHTVKEQKQKQKKPRLNETNIC